MILLSESPDETRGIGVRIGRILSGGERVVLTGDLGAGKTTLVRGIAEGAGCGDEVASPTFVLERVYEGRVRIRHIDLYRLKAEEVFALGIDDTDEIEDVILVEWGERMPESFRKNAIEIRLEFSPGGGEEARRILVSGWGMREADLAGAADA